MKPLTKIIIITGAVIAVIGGGYFVWDNFIREEPRGEGEVSSNTKRNKIIFTK